MGSLIITDVWLTPALFTGQLTLMTGLLAMMVCAVQLIPFFFNWEEDFPQSSACEE